jgi:uncharacterized protein YukJ
MFYVLCFSKFTRLDNHKFLILQYFQTFNKQPIPFDIERPVNNLDDIISNEFVRRRQR